MTENSPARVCVPVCVRSAAELRPSIARAAEVADIIELRLDCLEVEQLNAARAGLPALLGATRLPFIITFRPREQGGGHDLSLAERAAFWRDAPELLRDVPGLSGGAGARDRAFADLELDLLESPHAAALGRLFESFNVVCSHHDFQQTPSDLREIFGRMARTPARRRLNELPPLLRG